MPHAKFQSPSINIDRDFQLSAGHSQRARQTARQGNDQGVELRICPKGKGGAKIRSQMLNPRFDLSASYHSKQCI